MDHITCVGGCPPDYVVGAANSNCVTPAIRSIAARRISSYITTLNVVSVAVRYRNAAILKMINDQAANGGVSGSNGQHQVKADIGCVYLD